MDVKRVISLLALALATLSASTADAWNELGHRLTVEKAIEALPKGVKDFYKERRDKLQNQVRDPALREPRIVFEIDLIESFPFEELPDTRAAAVSKYGEDKLGEVGDLPWRIVETYEKLVEAFRAVDVSAIEALSAEIAYYVGEISTPLNLSSTGDGQPTGQEGLRERFDSRLMETYGNKLKFDAPQAIYLDRPAEYITSMVRKAYVWVDNILLTDYIARLGVASYDRFYYEGMWRFGATLLNDLLASSAQDTASFWYTAWTAAGKPALPK